ncbi:hypothetical protein BH10PSE17_BH10PSE17_23560 [soil metagenome]
MLLATPVALLGFWPGPRPGRACPEGKGLYPECLYVVSATDAGVSVKRPDGSIESVDLQMLREVVVNTNDSGPFGADVWWLLVGSDGSGCTYPGGATGEQDAIHWMQRLPGFDNGALVSAMGSTADANFVCWRAEVRQ